VRAAAREQFSSSVASLSLRAAARLVAPEEPTSAGRPFMKLKEFPIV
jgi:hypothetical protein